MLRVIWLSIAYPEWVFHPSNDSFILTLAVGIWMFVLLQVKREKSIYLFFVSIFLLGLVQVGIGLWQVISYVPNPSYPIKTPFFGTLGTPNGLGILLVLSLLCGAYIALTNQKKIWVIIGCIILLGGIILSESRTSVLILIVVSGCVFFIKLLQDGLGVKKVSATAAVLGLIGGWAFILYFMNEESSNGRWILWEITWTMIKENSWLGIGQGNYAIEFLNYQKEYFADINHQQFAYKASNIKQAHNEFLQSFASGGIIGGLFFMLLWLCPAFLMANYERKNSKLSKNTVHLAIHLAITLHSLMDSPLHVFPILLLGYSNIILATSNSWVYKPKKKVFVIVYGSILLLSGFIGYHSINKYRGQYYWKKGVSQTEEKNWQSSVIHLSNALQYLPKKGELMYQLGVSHIFNDQYSKGLYFTNESKKYFNDKNIYLSESYAYLQLGEYKKAEEKALIALSMFPTHLAPHLLLGEIYFYLGDKEKSKASLQKCMEEDIPITSPETKQISEDAAVIYQRFYGH